MEDPSELQHDEVGSERWDRVRSAALQYVGIGWFLTQVAAVVGRQIGLPPRFGDYLVIALGAGFVGTVGTSLWMRGAVRARVRRRRFAIAGLAAAAALGIWVVRGGAISHQAGSSGLVSERRGLFTTSTDVDGFFVVHPQEPLLATGIRVERGRTVRVTGEGRINIALARLVEAVEADDAVAYEWVGPAGEVDARGQPILRADRARPGRERCLVSPSAPYGALLAIFTPADRIAPSTARSLELDRDVFVVGADLVVERQSSGYLMLGVNDVYLDREECDPEEFTSGREAGSFFRDNIGFFTARVRVE